MPLISRPVPYADYPLDKAGHRRRDGAWLKEARLAKGSRLALLTRRGAPLLDANGVVWLEGAALETYAGPDAPVVFLGLDKDGVASFAAQVEAAVEAQLAAFGKFENIQMAAGRVPDNDLASVGCGKALLDWHARHGFCANCGAPSEMQDGGWKRYCEACKSEHFPRVDPVVIMLPVLGEKCCLGRQSRFPGDMFSALAGFIEPGESIEEACAREIAEEVGLNTVSVRYVATQPWPFPSSLMIGLIAEVDGDQTKLDPEEIDEVVWLARDQAAAAITGGAQTDTGRKVWIPPRTAIAHHIIKAWSEGS
jgi:NAD+ diphosphatase